MGSFNVGCGISNLSINEGDKMGFVILKKSSPLERDSVNMGHHNNLDYFMPVLPPVFGVYGDYGGMENIERSVTVEIIEDKFGVPLDVFMDCMSCHRTIYSDSGAINRNFFKGDRSWAGYDVEPATSFVKLGFTKQDDVNGLEVFSMDGFEIRQRFELINNDPDLKMYHWAIVTSATGEVLLDDLAGQFPDYLMDAFAKLTGLHPGFEAEDIERIKQLSSFHGMFFLKDVYEDMLGFMEANDDEYELSRYKSMWDGLRKVMTASEDVLQDEKNAPEFMGYINRMFRAVDNLTAFPLEYRDQFNRYGDGYEFNHIFTLPKVMSSINRMLMPSLNADQFGDDHAAMRAAEITQAVLKKRIRVQAEDDAWMKDDPAFADEEGGE